MRTVVLFGWLCFCVPPHVLTRGLRGGQSGWPRRFLGGVARIAGVRTIVSGEAPRARNLLVSNHRSWLDIPVLAGATGCAFVAKAELRDHWLLRWLCLQNGTVFVDRADRGGIGGQAAMVADALERARPLVLFAEGTVSPEPGLLPFRPPLLVAVAPAPEGVAVRPMAIDYGAAREDLAWRDGESGVANFRKVMGRRGRITARVQVLGALEPSPDRKVLTRAAQAAVTDALALSEPDALPYSGGES